MVLQDHAATIQQLHHAEFVYNVGIVHLGRFSAVKYSDSAQQIVREWEVEGGLLLYNLVHLNE
jgi:hypothetical protein